MKPTMHSLSKPGTLAFAALLLPVAAHAQMAGGSDVAGMLQNVVTYLSGSILTALAILAVIVVGISMMALRFSLMSILMVIGGIAIAFSATSLVTTIRG